VKSVLVIAASAVALLTIPAAAYSQDAEQAPPTTNSQWKAQQGAAAMDAQARDSAVGGAPMPGTQSRERSQYVAPCIVGLSCDIYHGS
jgi:Tfp pilus assembly protein PilV